MVQKYQHRTEQEWLQLINEYRASGFSDKAWCEKNSIPASSFYNAVTRLQNKACSIPSVQRTTITEPQTVVPIRVTDEHPSCIHMPYESENSIQRNTSVAVMVTVNGYSVQIFNQAAKDTIINTLLALQQLC